MSLSIFSSDDSSPDQARYQAALDRYLQRFDRVEQGSDFFHNFDRCRDDGEKRRVFFETARRSDVPLRAIGELLTYKDQLLVTVALQSLSSIENEEIRHRLVHLELIEGVDPEPAEIYALPNPDEYQPWSALVLQKLCEQAESGSDLARLSAAWTIEQLNYSQAYTGKLLQHPVAKIQDEILHRNLQRLTDQRFLSDRFQYQEFVEFWTFAPVSTLMEVLPHQPLSGDVLQRLGILGIEFVLTGIEHLDQHVIEAALRLAQNIAQDTRHGDAATQELLATVVLPVLDNTQLLLRQLTAQALVLLTQYLEPIEIAKVMVVLKRWNQAVEMGEVTIPVLSEVITDKLLIDGKNNDTAKMEAIKCVERIYTHDRQKIIEYVKDTLYDQSSQVRKFTANLLKPFKGQLDSLSNGLVDIILFERPSILKEVETLTQQEFQEIISIYRNAKCEYQKLYSNTLLYAKSRFTKAQTFISNECEIVIQEMDKLEKSLSKDLEKLNKIQGY
ncbi:MAG: hypothetical protein VKJ64_03945, partial [Leptolyngbyaceae bacterium]|nr:hypothetical protein [Leptolyngbyaceae bacterium]